ncbi:unnamed protein product [Orchesella dallaii]|uniref:Uncharacterized protein n=1 Tax=Orchesella dallaii TaxID=48710 RepID=A0ABP1S836_9HEXA
MTVCHHLLLFLEFFILVLYITTTHSQESIPSLTLPHTDWLSGFDDCYNALVLYKNIQLTPQSSLLSPPLSLFQFPAPIPNFNVVHFQRWTYCQSISIVFDLANGTNETIIDELDHVFGEITTSFQSLNPLRRSKNSIAKVRFKTLPHFLFFIVSNRSSSKESIDYSVWSSITKHQFLQIPFKIVYDIGHSRHGITFKNEIAEAVFMCKFCDYDSYIENTVIEVYPFTEFSLGLTQVSPSRLDFEEAYNNATGDGKHVIHYLSPYFQFQIDENLTRLNQIRNAKSASQICSIHAQLDEIILSILLENVDKVDGLRTDGKKFGYPWISVIEDVPPNVNFVPVETVSYNFVTCDGIGLANSLSFSALLHPFQWNVWLILVANIGITYGALFLTFKLTGKRTHLGIIVLHVIASLLSTTVETGKKNRLMMVKAVWLVSSLVLNPAYRGDNFAEIVTPIKFTKTWTNFLQLNDGNFTLFTPSNRVGMERTYFSSFGYAFLKWIRFQLGERKYEQFTKNEEKFHYEVLNSLPPLTKLFQKIKVFHLKNSSGVGNVIGNCNKTVFVDHEVTIKENLENYRRKNPNLPMPVYSGDDAIFKNMRSWYFTKSGGNYLHTKMLHLIGSGMYGLTG